MRNALRLRNGPPLWSLDSDRILHPRNTTSFLINEWRGLESLNFVLIVFDNRVARGDMRSNMVLITSNNVPGTGSCYCLVACLCCSLSRSVCVYVCMCGLQMSLMCSKYHLQAIHIHTDAEHAARALSDRLQMPFYRAAWNADAVLAMRFLSVCLSVKRVHCDKTEERYV